MAHKNKKVVAILGVGPGLGASLAYRFAREGYSIGLMSRSEDKLAPVEKKINDGGGRAVSVSTDATDPTSVAAGISHIRETLGAPDVFIYNAGAFRRGGILDLEAADFDFCWKANCYGAFLGAQQVLPDMIEAGRGTLLLTGATASTRGSANFSALAVGKFGLRALAQSMAREFGPQGIHVAHVIIDGQILSDRAREWFPDRDPDTFLHPDSIANVYWQLHAQDKTAWTLETDLRPSVEKF